MNIFLSLQSTPIYILKQQRIKYKSPRFKRALISPSLESRSFSLFTLSAVNLVILVLQDTYWCCTLHITPQNLTSLTSDCMQCLKQRLQK